MVVAQNVREAEITEQDSLLLTRNLLRIAIFNISYIRGLFPEKYFNDKSVPALEMKIKKLMPMDAESRRLIDWMEKGVYDALQKKYLKTLLFCVCEAVEGPMIEEYAFSFSYSDSDSQEVSMNINRSGSKKRGTFKCNSTSEITPNQMRSSACKMVRTLVQLMRTLDRMPEERTILMKLLYYDDVTVRDFSVTSFHQHKQLKAILSNQPIDYEPPFFRSCIDEEAHNRWAKNPLKMVVGNVNSKHLILALKVKSVLDPCEDENDELGGAMSIGSDSQQKHEFSESDSEVNQSQEDQYIVAPAVKEQPGEGNGVVDEDGTQDTEEDEQQLTRVKEWISSRHLDSVELTDVLSHFPDISVVLTEGNKRYTPVEFGQAWIMDKLVEGGVLLKTGADTYTKNKQKIFDYEFNVVKEEIDGRALPANKAAPWVDDDIYMKALYHSLAMEYVTAAKLQSKLDGEVNLTSARKLIDRMTRDGYLETKGNRRLGKRVIHSVLTEKTLMEVKRALGKDVMDIDAFEVNDKANQEKDITGINSTCGILQSFGSDLTRIRIRSDINQNGSVRTDHSNSKNPGNTPISRAAQTVASRESYIPGNENGRPNGSLKHHEEEDTVICSRSCQEKKSRKTSTVKEPIIQYTKRQKSQVA